MAVERMTFTVPSKLKKRAQTRRDVNWSAVVAKAIEDKLVALDVADRVFAKSKLTAGDVEEFADVLDEAMRRHFGAA